MLQKYPKHTKMHREAVPLGIFMVFLEYFLGNLLVILKMAKKSKFDHFLTNFEILEKSWL